jgi:hypothetical protein
METLKRMAVANDAAATGKQANQPRDAKPKTNLFDCDVSEIPQHG